jgi:hypothetical protein
MSILILIRQKQSASYDPFYDGLPALYGHWLFASVDGNRGRVYGGVYEVEMYVSLLDFFYVTLNSIMTRVTIPIVGERDGKIREKSLTGKGKLPFLAYCP